MENLDGKSISDRERFRHWKCGQGHILGVTERVREALQVNETTIRYYTTRLLLFREAVDMTADIPAEIDVASSLNGRILSMVHRCSVCGGIREWHPDNDVVEFVASAYLAE